MKKLGQRRHLEKSSLKACEKNYESPRAKGVARPRLRKRERNLEKRESFKKREGRSGTAAVLEPCGEESSFTEESITPNPQ